LQLGMIDAAVFREMMASGTASLYAHKAEVDALNVFPVPDGDTGTNMYLTFQAAVREISKNSSDQVGVLLDAAAYGALMGARGNSGVIVSQFFRGFIKALSKDLDVMSTPELARGFRGAATACYSAVRQPVEGTILTIIREAADRAALIAEEADIDPARLMEDVYQHSCRVLQQTPEMLPVLKQAGVVDAGGQGLVYFLQGWVQLLKGEPVVEAAGMEAASQVTSVSQYAASEMLGDGGGELDFQYCTEFILKGKQIDLEEVKNSLNPHGDCLLVVGDENTVKIHIHTNNPGIILDFAVRLGDLFEIQIHNMVEQSQQRLQKAAEADGMRHTGIVAVAAGDGLEQIFHNLGAQVVVNGGQTMNPSVEDLAKAVNSIPCNDILILPNNSNIVMTAGHVQEIVDKHVHVVPTQSVPEGLAALISFSDEKPLEENAQKMAERSRAVTTGEITYAVRSTKIGEFDIQEGDIIGLVNGEIVTFNSSPEAVIEDTIRKVPQAGESLITVYYGSDVAANTAQDLLNRLEKAFPDAEVELYYGGQPLYYYLFSVE
jgi:DAK2 domain fusion protein YloV